MVWHCWDGVEAWGTWIFILLPQALMAAEEIFVSVSGNQGHEIPQRNKILVLHQRQTNPNLVKALLANFYLAVVDKRRNHKMSLYPKELRRTFLWQESCGSGAKLNILNRAQEQVDLSRINERCRVWSIISPRFLGFIITDGVNKPPNPCFVLQTSLWFLVRDCWGKFIAPRGISVLHDALCAWCGVKEQEWFFL